MSNGVAVMLASSIHSGSPALGLYITSFTTTCSASAPVVPASIDERMASLKNDFFMCKILWLLVRKKFGQSYECVRASFSNRCAGQELYRILPN